MSLKRKTKLKIWGWVCILIGVISFISIIMRGNPNLGPSVWVAIGVLTFPDFSRHFFTL